MIDAQTPSSKNAFLVPHKRYVNPATTQEVVFIGMAHLWPQDIFTHVSALLAGYRRQGYSVHHEGVRATKPELTGLYGKISRGLTEELNGLYRQIAKLAKGQLVFQRDVKHLYGEQDSLTSDVTQGELLRELGLVRASAFVGILKLARKLMGTVDENDKAVTESILEKLSTVAKEDSKLPLVTSALLDFRNRKLIEKVLASSSDAVLPWGIAHGKGLGELLQAKGFELVRDASVEVKYSL